MAAQNCGFEMRGSLDGFPYVPRIVFAIDTGFFCGFSKSGINRATKEGCARSFVHFLPGHDRFYHNTTYRRGQPTMFSSLHSSAHFDQNQPSICTKTYSARDLMPPDLPSGSELQIALGGSFFGGTHRPPRSIQDRISELDFPMLFEPQIASANDPIMTEENNAAPTCAVSTEQAVCMTPESCSQNCQVVYRIGGVDQVSHAALDMGPNQNKSSLSTGRLPTAEQWRSHRDAFTQLYMVQNKTLKEVIEIMKDQYHFSAT